MLQGEHGWGVVLNALTSLRRTYATFETGNVMYRKIRFVFTAAFVLFGHPTYGGDNWSSIHGTWTQSSCKNENGEWFIFSGGFRAPGLTCAASERHKTLAGFSVFLECRNKSSSVTYMGNVFVISAKQIKIDLTEYKGGTGAPDVDTTLTRCH